MTRSGLDPASISMKDFGEKAYDLVRRLYPVCRSITGEGLRESLRILNEEIPIELHEVPSGTPVFDWTVPREWNIRDAYIADSSGRRVVDFNASNLHVVNYSIPIKARLRLKELRPHLYTIADYPDWIPYRTTYYKEDWGFCLSETTLQSLQDGEYEVCIDSTLENGSLTYGECFIKGDSDDEILISSHACHPSLCNDNLSGLAMTTLLARHLGSRSLRYSYRFLFLPGTIGAITWLSRNEDLLPSIRHGLVVACVGDAGKFHYKRSRRGDTEIDRAVRHVLEHSGHEYRIMDFTPYGYDERQYCSPGINLPVGSLTRTPHGKYPEYHTSADDLTFVSAHNIAESAAQYLSIFHLLENNRQYVNLNPKCEPQLGRRGLYRMTGGFAAAENFQLAMLWTLNLSDGDNTLLDIADRSGLRFSDIYQAACALFESGLLRKSDSESTD